jgi:glutamate racemase
MNRIVITDSGLGGLSVAASLYEELRNISLYNSVDLIFVNALPETGKGYNTMPDIASKVKIFNNVLTGTEERFSPDLIGIACNTLSVIADNTEYYTQNQEKILGIVECGIESLLVTRQKKEPAIIIIFGTETTIEMDKHRQLLIESGVSQDTIIPQTCSGLASAIENDPNGKETRRIIEESVKQAVNKIDVYRKPVILYLACTHYGYVSTLFETTIKKEGSTVSEAFDPNHSMVENIYSRMNLPITISTTNGSQPKISIYSRCTIQDHEIKSIVQLLSQKSPDTARALTNYKKIPELFNPF